ncbi:dihydrodipicolinate reductase [Ekhidna lutea]|uniref:4-hydroxy-tetrahydrodipicolinate reductase n=1 Tax=Ekhidna lutea TaxID=447679 RepID=A0A239HGZ8_EKHLU|nr:4-hydroxy-tetrahydrodipicolinate reductase [Ekhidna lutea]SNS79534.1 dihydrodipicolinate reductase [Ekhidna lutea]
MKIALIGYGKMGKAIEQIALGEGHTIDFIIKSPKDLAHLAPNSVDLAIEFTQPESAFQNLSHCLKNQIPVISGTTGWLDQLTEIETFCKEKNGTFLYASNFSIGVNLFFELNKWLAEKMAQLEFRPAIKEIHHTEKKDSPSGTAITLAEGITASHPLLTSWVNEESTDHKKLGIVSERIPNVPGTHTVSYSSPLESIEITHTAHNRSVFAQGVMKVGEWIHSKKGVFTMSDFINDN